MEIGKEYAQKKRPKTYNDAIIQSFAEALHDEYKKIFTTMFERSNVLTKRELSWMDTRMRVLGENTKILVEHLSKPQEDENDDKRAEKTGEQKL